MTWKAVAVSVEEWIESRTRRQPLGTQATKVLQVLASQPHFASYSAAREVADQAGVNISTVTRTAQAIGFAGWPDFQLELRNRYLASLSASDVLSEHEDETADPITVSPAA
jgi:DNA-binding MurR/RpiR family transcriptional regulator